MLPIMIVDNIYYILLIISKLCLILLVNTHHIKLFENLQIVKFYQQSKMWYFLINSIDKNLENNLLKEKLKLIFLN